MAWSLGGVMREQSQRRGDAPMITYGPPDHHLVRDGRPGEPRGAGGAAGLGEQSRVAFTTPAPGCSSSVRITRPEIDRVTAVLKAVEERGSRAAT